MRLRCGDDRMRFIMPGDGASFIQDCRLARLNPLLSLPCTRAIARVYGTSAARNAAMVSHRVIRLIQAGARDCGYCRAALCVLSFNGAQEGLAYACPRPRGGAFLQEPGAGVLRERSAASQKWTCGRVVITALLARGRQAACRKFHEEMDRQGHRRKDANDGEGGFHSRQL
jgi:hypothetical protein